MRPVTVFAHMCPPYITVAAPLVKLSRGRLLLWYAHTGGSAALRRAERLTDAVLTTFPGSYPGTSAKVRAIGQAIDTDQFRLQPGPPRTGPFRLVALGRTSVNKNYPVMISAVKEARNRGVDVSLRIVGPSTTAAERANRLELDQLIRTLDLGEVVTVESDIVHDRIPEALAGAHALVNTTRSGSADKVVLEAMACGRPPLVSSAVFADLVDTGGPKLAFRENDVDDLTNGIVRLAAAPAAELDFLGAELRRRIEQRHSLGHWADEVVAIASEGRAPPAARSGRR